MVSISALMLLCLSTGDFACSWVHFDQLIDLADDVAFQASDDVAFAFAFGGSAGHVSLRGLMVLHANNHCPIDRSVELSVSAVVDAMLAAGHPWPGRDGADPGEFRERGLGVDALRVVTGDDEDLCSGIDADTKLVQQVRCPLHDELLSLVHCGVSFAGYRGSHCLRRVDSTVMGTFPKSLLQAPIRSRPTGGSACYVPRQTVDRSTLRQRAGQFIEMGQTVPARTAPSLQDGAGKD